MTFKNLSQIEEWRNEIGLVYFGMASVGFDTSPLSTASSRRLELIEVGEFRDALDDLVRAVDEADGGILGDTLLSIAETITFPTLGLGAGAVDRLREALDGDASTIRAEVAAVKTLLKGAGDGASVTDALLTAFDGEIGTSNGPDDIDGGPGVDKIDLKGGNDIYEAGGGNDVVRGGGGWDRLFGEAGNDRVYGGEGNDRVVGGQGADKLWGNAGNDQIYGDDLIVGGPGGNDRMWGGAGRDDMDGQAGNDRLWGEAGNDKLDGGTGNDQLRGGAGDDVIEGAGGNDRLWGNAGRDVFVFAGEGRDVIKDFRNDVDTVEIDMVGAGPSNERAWLKANSEAKNGDLHIEAAGGKLILEGFNSWKALLDDIDFV